MKLDECSLEWCTRVAVVRWTPPGNWTHAKPGILCHEHSLGIRRLAIGRFDPVWPVHHDREQWRGRRAK